MKSLSFSRRLMLTGIALTAIPLLIIASALGWLSSRTGREARSGAEMLANSDLEHVSTLLQASSAIYEDALREQTQLSLRVAADALKRHGGATLRSDTVTWTATNQLDSSKADVTLPGFAAGSTWFGQERASGARVPVVDEVLDVAHARCTVFQRMNDRGDMLRVATNVLKDGQRAIGTYIPATEPDGAANAVVSAVMQKRTFIGRAFVVDGWYVSAYEPIVIDGEVAGMLFVGVPERDAVARLMREMDGVKVGDTGRVFILHAKGAAAGKVVRPLAGEAVGASLIDARDAEGRTWVRDLVGGAATLGAAQIARASFALQDGSGAARPYVAAYSYFAPWDWVIAVAVPEDELFRTATRVSELSRATLWWVLWIGLFGLALAGGTWQWVARRTEGQLQPVVQRVASAAQEISAAAGSVAAASNHLAQGSAQQAASSEQASSALAQVAAMARRNAEAAAQAATVAQRGQEAAARGSGAMDRMSTAMSSIEASGNKVSKIARAIDELSFQTQLLALNAAVEAARAGELGQGFAVVAEEVRSLSNRSAEAAKEASANVDQAIASTQQGAALSTDLRETLSQLVDRVRDLGSAVGTIAGDSAQQRTGIDQATQAVDRLANLGRETAAGAEEAAAAAEELWAQSEALSEASGSLVAFFTGTTQGSAAPRVVASRHAQPESHVA